MTNLAYHSRVHKRFYVPSCVSPMFWDLFIKDLYFTLIMNNTSANILLSLNRLKLTFGGLFVIRNTTLYYQIYFLLKQNKSWGFHFRKLNGPKAYSCNCPFCIQLHICYIHSRSYNECIAEDVAGLNFLIELACTTRGRSCNVHWVTRYSVQRMV